MAPPAGPVPPELPPSVEEAYRRKCIELKRRLNEVEEGNDVTRQRVARLLRGVDKLRLERAFLLEQLSKRTSTNVEDSEGSPSPPPTPKEKPLRTKRGHRKPDFLMTDPNDGRPGSTFIQQGPVTLSPSSDAFSHTHPDALRNSTPGAQPLKRQVPTNGGAAPNSSKPAAASMNDRAPKNPFDIYCKETRPSMAATSKDEEDALLARGWANLEGELKDDYGRRYEESRLARASEKDTSIVVSQPEASEQRDEDVEMADDVATPKAGAAEGGFTAVNRS